MADEEKVTLKKVIKSVEVEKYPTQDLIENCEALTGYKKEVASGALFNCNEKEITKEKFREEIEEFLKREVK
ncbi:hypothetical protein [Clostridium botulinum]|uniref:hypothetical protein n=2 Tax=Clostridium botulinum TaxID=1491 RepID=UPI0004D81D4C|nr:hypothetical protein [Clostridium botulinum]KEH96177.1 hypothetical protein Z953_p0244 [Clostridium botulinum D str. 16868]MCD3202804.1 hypothetical protein [Clostridium botulinum C/D]MCD3253905.1 hypothetical protein [Clostridium botulinum C/D]MCD3279413.1 hypothetical protein [Clostridium botulinum C/D]MCD3281608.1 hypothetical protein [Clostridium botulinum C/D]